MTKTYKHKTLGWIAKPAIDDDVRIKESLQGKYDIYKGNNYCNVNNHRMSEKELIELGFEEVIEKEKDWIDNSVEEFYKLGWKFTNEKDLKEFREILEKHAPKERKFARQEIIDYHTGAIDPQGQRRIYWHDINPLIEFLNKHNLLAEEPQGETS